jgi:hypothetical protein
VAIVRKHSGNIEAHAPPPLHRRGKAKTNRQLRVESLQVHILRKQNISRVNRV